MTKKLCVLLISLVLACTAYAQPYETTNYTLLAPEQDSSDWPSIISRDLISMDLVMHLVSMDANILSADAQGYLKKTGGEMTGNIGLGRHFITDVGGISVDVVSADVMSADTSLYVRKIYPVHGQAGIGFERTILTDVLGISVDTVSTDIITSDTYAFKSRIVSPDITAGMPKMCVSIDPTGAEHLNIFINGVWKEITLS